MSAVFVTFHSVLKVEANMRVLSWNLGAGETTALSFALHNPQYSAIIDDRAARRCAHVLNISLLGTAGVIVLAKRRGLAPESEFKAHWQTLGNWKENIPVLSAHFHVSPWVIVRRALALELITLPDYQDYVSRLTAAYKAKKKMPR